MRQSKLMLSGYAGADPTITNTQFHKIAKVRLAVSVKSFDENSQQLTAKTEWHTIVFWDDVADLAERYISKGTRFSVNGYPKERSWKDKDGVVHDVTEINASEFKIITRQGNTEQENEENI